jgi:hypothetical protein
MKRFLLISILFLSLSFNSCSYNEIDQITIGIYCGECPSHCFQGYTITGDSVVKISANYYNDIQNSSKTKISLEEARKVKKLRSLLPSNLSKFNETIGCPDCHDQCGIYVSYKTNSGSRVILIDPDEGKHPSEFNSFILELKEVQLI